MCLNFATGDIAKSALIRQSGKTFTRYKVLAKGINGSYRPPLYGRTIKSNDFKSNRPSMKLEGYELDGNVVDQGIHVCTTIEHAKTILRWNTSERKVFKVLCEAKDLVMSSSIQNEEVYMKVVFVDLFPEPSVQKSKHVKNGNKEKGKNMVNWNKVLNVPGANVALANFAQGNLSGNSLREAFAHTGAGGEVRNLIYTNRVQKSRQLVRKALSRRGLV